MADQVTEGTSPAQPVASVLEAGKAVAQPEQGKTSVKAEPSVPTVDTDTQAQRIEETIQKAEGEATQASPEDTMREIASSDTDASDKTVVDQASVETPLETMSVGDLYGVLRLYLQLPQEDREEQKIYQLQDTLRKSLSREISLDKGKIETYSEVIRLNAEYFTPRLVASILGEDDPGLQVIQALIANDASVINLTQCINVLNEIDSVQQASIEERHARAQQLKQVLPVITQKLPGYLRNLAEEQGQHAPSADQLAYAVSSKRIEMLTQKDPQEIAKVIKELNSGKIPEWVMAILAGLFGVAVGTLKTSGQTVPQQG